VPAVLTGRYNPSTNVNRLLLSLVVFSCLSLLWLAWYLFQSVRKLAEAGATGIGFARPSTTELVLNLAIFAVMALVSYWLSGRFVKKG